jgi:hypothetical protein
MTSSVQGVVFFPPNKAAYSISKAAVVAMGKCFSRELKPFNIIVNLVTPAGIETKMAEDLRKWGQQMPITVPPEVISPAYLFLSSDLAKKKYSKGNVVEINAICEFLPNLKEEFGEKNLETKELIKLAEVKLKKDQFTVLKKNADLIAFMVNYG